MGIYNADSILASIQTEINGSVPDSMVAEIKKRGYQLTSQEEQDLRAVFADVFDSASVSKCKPAVELELQKLEDKVVSKTNQELKANEYQQQSAQDRQVSEKRVEQGSEVSGKFAEPPKVDNAVNYSNVVDLPDADNSLATDFPNTFGMIDDSGNFYSINRKTKFVQIVHSSGTCIKIDRNGDVTMHTKGTLKHIVDGDMLLQVGGGLDIYGKKGVQILGEKEVTVKSDGNLIVDTSKNEFKAQTEFKDKVEIGGTLGVKDKVKAESDVKVTGNVEAQEVIAGTVIKLTAHKHTGNQGAPTSPPIP